LRIEASRVFEIAPKATGGERAEQEKYRRQYAQPNGVLR
jgi:hypothetical protein